MYNVQIQSLLPLLCQTSTHSKIHLLWEVDINSVTTVCELPLPFEVL